MFDDSRRQTFVFRTDEDEEAPTFRCRRDREPFAACTSPHTWSGIPDGEHLLCIAATDASGTAEQRVGVRGRGGKRRLPTA